MITKIKNISNDILLFDKITLEGSLTVLVGGNGVGKTTLIKALYKRDPSLEIEGDTSKLVLWRNAVDNQRYNNPNPFSKNYTEDLFDLYLTNERSEGENVVHSFLVWAESIPYGSIVLIDELDSGLSIDNLNGVGHVIASLISEKKCQVIMSINSWHFVYCFDDHLVSLVDGKKVNFNRDYEKFIEYSQKSALIVSRARSKAKKKTTSDRVGRRSRRGQV